VSGERSGGPGALAILIGLVLFGAAEVAVAMARPSGTTGILILLMIGQGTFFAYFSMHLRDETRALRRMVAAPMVISTVYAVVLIAESVWRHKP